MTTSLDKLREAKRDGEYMFHDSLWRVCPYRLGQIPHGLSANCICNGTDLVPRRYNKELESLVPILKDFYKAMMSGPKPLPKGLARPHVIWPSQIESLESVELWLKKKVEDCIALGWLPDDVVYGGG